jgi:hypothetical protein
MKVIRRGMATSMIVSRDLQREANAEASEIDMADQLSYFVNRFVGTFDDLFRTRR